MSSKRKLTTEQKMMQSVIGEINECLVEREDIVKGMAVGTLAGMNIFALGLPGTAKSMLCDAWLHRLKPVNGTPVTKYQTLVTKYTEYDEVFGPMNLHSLADGVFTRHTSIEDPETKNIVNYLPAVQVAMLDEIFKGNEAFLQSLLPVLAERRVHVAGLSRPIPLEFVLAASNETPEEGSLNALWDRFQMRFVVDYVQDDDNWKKMVTKQLRQIDDVDASFTLDDLNAMREQMKTVVIPDEVLDTYRRLEIKARNAKGLRISDRRDFQLLDVVRACAWLDGRWEATKGDLYMPLMSTLWSSVEEIPVVQELLSEVVFPNINTAKEAYNEAKEFEIQHKEANALSGGERSANRVEAKNGIEDSIQLVDLLLEGCDAAETSVITGYKTKMAKMLKHCQGN